MNLLLIFPEECESESQARLTDRRAQDVLELHQLKQGISLKAGLLGGRIGTATVAHCSEHEILLDLNLQEEPPVRPGISLIIGACRPQTVKKVLEFSASAGVDEIHFVRTSESDKNYLDSKVLSTAERNEHLYKGLEQGVDTILPQVFVHRFFKEFIAEFESRDASHTQKFIGTLADRSSDPLSLRQKDPVIVALGPEAGFSAYEQQTFEELGFQPISLGPRQFRIEQALCMLVGQVMAGK